MKREALTFSRFLGRRVHLLHRERPRADLPAGNIPQAILVRWQLGLLGVQRQ